MDCPLVGSLKAQSAEKPREALPGPVMPRGRVLGSVCGRKPNTAKSEALQAIFEKEDGIISASSINVIKAILGRSKVRTVATRN
jgi:hypothetical protein